MFKEKLNKIMAKKGKGFTLIEIIIVLVILAILAAAMIPTMLGYVQESKGKTYVTAARAVKVAGQSIITEKMALGEDASTIETALNTPDTDEYNKLVELSGADDVFVEDKVEATFTVEDSGSISKLVYSYKVSDSTTYYVTIEGEAASVSTTAPTAAE